MRLKMALNDFYGNKLVKKIIKKLNNYGIRHDVMHPDNEGLYNKDLSCFTELTKQNENYILSRCTKVMNK